MSQLPHLFPQNTASTHPYTYPRIVGSSEFKLPPRDKVIHASNLTSQIKSAKQQFDSEIKAKDVYEEPKGIILDFESSQEFELQLKSLDNKTNGIELRASSVDSNNVMHGVVFVPQEKITHFIKRINEYASVYTKKGEPKHKNLVASINQIKLGTLKSFWTDNAPFPEKLNISTWWEIWLSEPTNAHESVKQLRKMAEKHNLLVSNHHLSFPDRSVVLMKSTFDELAELENLFDIIAELRIAKILAGEFMNLMPRDQAEMIDELIQRITPPALDAPTVCHLDTGVNRGHPLLKLGLEEKHLLAVDPTWDGADGDINQHGTGMAGLALYGCLTEVLNSTDKIHLKHRLESVKFLPNRGQNDPDLYGEISSQAVSRIEIIEPERVQRAYCLTITTNDHRDEGYPSSWSAALDKITSGADENKAPSRLIFVSAGNTPNEGRNEYPNSNQLQPVEDPAQSWNVITVGGFTNRSIIKDQTYRDWKPIASDGGLSPCSRTSILWQDKEWPIKPDIVMEAGNQAIDPSTKQADYVDDLSLLTVCTKLEMELN